MVIFLIAPEDAELAPALADALKAGGHSVERLPGLADYREPVREGATQLVVALAASERNGVEEAIAFAEANNRGLYLIYVSDDIAAADFRRLLNTRAAEWIPAANAIEEIDKAIANSPAAARSEVSSGANFVSFVPAGGGVGNTTITVESALHHATLHRAKEPNCCIVDLNFQQGNVCDLLDLQPNLDIDAIAQDPGRLDYRLLDAFRSRSDHGVDVYAPPKFPPPGANPLNPEAVFALCNVLSERYARVHADFPAWLFPWMFDIIRASDKVIVSTTFSVPAALRVQALQGQLPGIDPKRVAIAVNRFQSGMFKKSLSRQNFEASIDANTFIYISDDSAFTSECANIGSPMMIAGPKRRISKDIQQLERFIDPPEAKSGLFERALSKFTSHG